MIADGEYYGMQTFDQSLFHLYKDGQVTLRQAMAAASQPHDFRLALEHAGPGGRLRLRRRLRR